MKNYIDWINENILDHKTIIILIKSNSFSHSALNVSSCNSSYIFIISILKIVTYVKYYINTPKYDEASTKNR